MATHTSVLAWRIPWTEEPGGIQSMGPQRVGHDEQKHGLLWAGVRMRPRLQWVEGVLKYSWSERMNQGRGKEVRTDFHKFLGQVTEMITQAYTSSFLGGGRK